MKDMTKIARILAIAVLLLGVSTLTAKAALVFEFPIGPDQEVPPATSDAQGLGKLTLDGTEATLELAVLGIGIADLFFVQGTPIHIHQGARGVNGGILVHIDPTTIVGNALGFTSVSAFSVSEATADLIEAGLTYVNIHTTSFNGGEIRGQIVPLPAGVVLFGTAMIGLAYYRRRQAK